MYRDLTRLRRNANMCYVVIHGLHELSGSIIYKRIYMHGMGLISCLKTKSQPIGWLSQKLSEEIGITNQSSDVTISRRVTNTQNKLSVLDCCYDY